MMAAKRRPGRRRDALRVLEIVVVFGVALALLVVAAGGGFAYAGVLLGVGAAVTGCGLLVGVLAGLVYHAALFRALSPSGALPPGWWWRPTSLHAQLAPAQRRRVLPWFYAGAAGFLVTLAGCALVLAAILTL
jgi:hypothetical protein